MVLLVLLDLLERHVNISKCLGQATNDEIGRQTETSLIGGIDNTVAQTCAQKDMESGGARDCRDHGGGQARLDGIQALAKREKGAATTRDTAGDDRPEEGKFKHTGSDVLVGQTNEVDRNASTKNLKENNEACRQDLGLGHNISHHGKVMMDGVADNNGKGKCIVGQHNGDSIQKNRDEDAATGAGHDERNDLESRGCILGQRGEHLAPVIEAVAKHAHVSDSGSRHKEQVGQRVLEQEGSRVRWGRFFSLLLGKNTKSGKLEQDQSPEQRGTTGRGRIWRKPRAPTLF